MDERLRFVARLLEGEKMSVLCREFDGPYDRLRPISDVRDSLRDMISKGLEPR